MDLEYDVQILILIQKIKEKEERREERETETGDRESGLQRSEDGKKT